MQKQLFCCTALQQRRLASGLQQHFHDLSLLMKTQVQQLVDVVGARQTYAFLNSTDARMLKARWLPLPHLVLQVASQGVCVKCSGAP